jgi:hypothetical protein
LAQLLILGLRLARLALSVAWARLSGPGLSVIGAAATGDGLEDLSLFAVLFDHVADVDDALVAGARALFGGWVRVGCGRVLAVHSDLPRLRLWAGLRGC